MDRSSLTTFDSSTETDEVISGIGLSGRTAVVTGAASGIGFETARSLASAGAHVVLAVRDPIAGDTAAAEILAEFPRATLSVLELDLASLDSVRVAAAEFAIQHSSLDLLIANAGVMYTPFTRTVDGSELQFGTNHLGHFLLAQLLLPALENADHARIVVVTSAGHRRGPINLDDLNFEREEYDKFLAYRRSKTANILMVIELERRLGGSGIQSFAAHPGVCTTNLFRHMSDEDHATLRNAVGSAALVPKTPRAAAATTVWAATSTDLAEHGGSYLADCQISQAEEHATDPALAAGLWKRSEELTGIRAAGEAKQ